MNLTNVQLFYNNFKNVITQIPQEAYQVIPLQKLTGKIA